MFPLTVWYVVICCCFTYLEEYNSICQSFAHCDLTTNIYLSFIFGWCEWVCVCLMTAFSPLPLSLLTALIWFCTYKFIYASCFTKALEIFLRLVNLNWSGSYHIFQFSHLAWVQTERKAGGLGDLKYPLVSDVTKSISKSYGVLIPDQVYNFFYWWILVIDEHATPWNNLLLYLK